MFLYPPNSFLYTVASPMQTSHAPVKAEKGETADLLRKRSPLTSKQSRRLLVLEPGRLAEPSPGFDVPEALECSHGARVLVLWADTGGVARWFEDSEAGHRANLFCAEPDPRAAMIGRRVVPSAEWVVTDPFAAGAFAGSSPFDLVLVGPSTRRRLPSKLAAPWQAEPLMAIDVALSLGRRVAAFVPLALSPTVAGDVFRERFYGAESDTEAVARLRVRRPSMRAVPLKLPVSPQWSLSSPWGGLDLVYAWTDIEASDVIVAVHAGPKGIRFASQQAVE